MTTAVQATTEMLRSLANQHRLAIVLALRQQPRCVHDLVDALGVSQPLVSQHLRVLRGARLVRAERRGREMTYSLSDDAVAQVVLDAVVQVAGVRAGEP